MASHRNQPPQYLEGQPRQSLVPGKNVPQSQISRKPVGTAKAKDEILQEEYDTSMMRNRQMIENEAERLHNLELEGERPELPPRPGLSLRTAFPENLRDAQSFNSPRRTDTAISTTSTLNELRSPSTASSLQAPSASSSFNNSPEFSRSSSSASFQKAYREARHFAGGLIQRPSESTKHFTILRHSHGLVFYQGSSTSLAISIFSDAPLPSERTLWLQSKGWSGKTGMRARALIGRNVKWLNVTPTVAVRADQLDPDDERAWQRDFEKFRKRVRHRSRESHLLRQTALVHIPAEAGDGYFQILMCLGENKKKILCPSPVFRLLSTSTSPSSIRGASLSTLPLELGAMALSIQARATVGSAVSVAVSPFSSQVQQYMPSWFTRKATSTALGGVEKRLNSTAGDGNASYDQERDGPFFTPESLEMALQRGPITPYPVQFVARSEDSMNRDTGAEQLDIPTISLLGVPDGISPHLHGYYFGWSRIVQKGDKGKSMEAESLWCQVIISALRIDLSRLARVNITHVGQKNFTMSFIDDLEDLPPDGTPIEIQVMGFIRPDEPLQRANMNQGLEAGDEAAAEAAMFSEVSDISLAQQFLDHPAWAPEAASRALARGEEVGKLERVKSGFTNTKTAAQRQIDKVPFAKVGIRAPGANTRDKGPLSSGFYVQR